VLLSHLPAGFILPQAALARTPVPAIGTGRYRLAGRVPGTSVLLVANPFYREPASFASLLFRVIPDGDARVQALLSGAVQLIENVPARLVADLERRSDLVLAERPGLRVLFLALRMDAPPFSAAPVREALDLALDRDELIRRVFAGRATRATQLVPPAVLGYDPSIMAPTPDLARARMLLAQAGYPSGFAVRLDGPRDRYRHDALILDEVARQLAQVDVRVSVNARPKQEFFDALEQHLEFYLLGWACNTIHAGDALDALMHSPRPGGLGANNVQGLRDPQLDALIDAANRSPTLAQRRLLLASALGRVAALRPILPLVVQTEVLAWSRALTWTPPLDMALRLEGALPASAQTALAR
jgi:peptide/nickel transport system substrate-binding protein